jgi:hypothetical protein
MWTGHLPLWLASVSGIAAGMCLNYVVLDRLVFSAFARLAATPGLHFLQAAGTTERAARG